MSIFLFVSPFFVNFVHHCALSSILRCRVCLWKFNRWVQVLKCTYTHSMGYNWLHRPREICPLYTTFSCMFRKVEQRRYIIRASLNGTSIHVWETSSQKSNWQVWNVRTIESAALLKFNLEYQCYLPTIAKNHYTIVRSRNTHKRNR